MILLIGSPARIMYTEPPLDVQLLPVDEDLHDEKVQ